MASPQWKPEPLPDGSYADDTRPYTSQDVINYIPEFAENQQSRGPVKLIGAPGLQPFSTVGTGFRGLHNVEGKLFAVSGNKLYQVSANGTTAQLGTIAGIGRVSMAHNQIAGGNQLLIVNGSSGYIWDTVTSKLTKITAAGFPGAIVADFIGQLFVTVEPQGRYFQNSALVDGLTWSALETYEGESSPDRIVSLKSITANCCCSQNQPLKYSTTQARLTRYLRTKALSFPTAAVHGMPWSTWTTQRSLLVLTAPFIG